MPLHHITRSSLSDERIQRNAAGQVELKLEAPWQDGTTHLVMSPLEFMQPLAALVPRPRLHLVRFHGVLAPNAKLRPRVLPPGPEVPLQTEVAAASECETKTAQARPHRISWARLLERVFDINMQHCRKQAQNCAYPMGDLNMKIRNLLTWAGIVLAMGALSTHAQSPQQPKWLKELSSRANGFFEASSDYPPGVGVVAPRECAIGDLSQPPEFAGNSLLVCDANEGARVEAAIAVNPTNPQHAVGAFMDFSFHFLGSRDTRLRYVTNGVSVTFDGGKSWRHVHTPLGADQQLWDPSVAITRNGRVYIANISDNASPKNTNIVTYSDLTVSTSDDRGLSWSRPAVVARGRGSDALGVEPNVIFNDKPFIGVDPFVGSARPNRVYITWARHQWSDLAGTSRGPIVLTYSDNGRNWSAPREISGSGSFCQYQSGGGPEYQCDENVASNPAVAPNGKVYVGYWNFNFETNDVNQMLMVRSDNYGETWAAPVKITATAENMPMNAVGRKTLTGCQHRWNPLGNGAADPSDPTGNTFYMLWTSNAGDYDHTNSDVYLARTADGGATWTYHVVDNAANDQYFAFIAVAPDGRVDVSYHDRSYSAGQHVCQYGYSLTRMTFSSAGALLTKTKTRLDTGLSDPGHARWGSPALTGNTTFLGDYSGVAIGSDGATWSIWADMRRLVSSPPLPTLTHANDVVATRTPKP